MTQKKAIAPQNRFRTQFDQSYKGIPGQKNFEPSMTQPDMSLTVKQLLLNHTRGISSGVKEHQGEYFEDEEIPVFQDITELVEYKERFLAKAKAAEDKINDLKQKIKAQEKAEAEKKQKASEKAPEDPPAS